jgi:nitroimidazol reductase NimA-like FMN-containing flavoprotein (pyridoxamine 5'-phosphate oxidase superfamily)
MRRSEKEITERSAIDEIINRCLVCRLALSDGGIPYVIPMNFGYEGNTLYFIQLEKEGNWTSCGRITKSASNWTRMLR